MWCARVLVCSALILVLAACGGETAPSPLACAGEAEASCVTPCGTAGRRTRLPDACELGPCAPPGEICNGADDDCDERIDEALGCVRGASEACETSCGSTGTHTCGEDCAWATCTPPLEVCGNELDDDCDGVVDGPPRVLESHAFADAPRPVSLVADEDGLWTTRNDGLALVGIHRITSSGELGAASTDQSFDWAPSEFPTLRASSGRVAMAWAHDLTLHVAVVDPDGEVRRIELLPDGFFLPMTVGLEWVGPTLSVAYTRVLPGGVRRIFVQRITEHAERLDAEVPVSRGSGVASSPALAMAPPHRTQLVAWADDRSEEIYTALFGPELQPIRDEAPLTATDEGERAIVPDVASDGVGFLVVWSQGDPIARQIYAATVDAGGHAGTPRRISVGRGASGAPRVVWSGAEYWVVWKLDSGARETRLLAARVGRGGARRGEIVEVSRDGGWMGNRPEVAFHDGLLHVLWTSDGGSHLAVLGCG